MAREGFGRQEPASSRSGKDARREGEQRSAAAAARPPRSGAECEPGEAQGFWFGGRSAETAYRAGSLALTRTIGGMLFGVGPRDPLTLIATALLLVLVALAACWIPARRAARIDPMVALRCE